MSQSQRGGLLMFILGCVCVLSVAIIAGQAWEPIDHIMFILGLALWFVGAVLFIFEDSLHMSTIDNSGESVYNVDRETLHSPPFSEARLPRAGLTSLAATPQPHPAPGTECVADYVIRDIEARVQMGLEKYGTKLQAFNGRDALWDAYQECLDQAMYLCQLTIETGRR